MHRITIAHSIHHHVSSACPLRHLSIEPFDPYYNRRLLWWEGNVACIPLTRAPRQLLLRSVDNPRPLWCSQTNWSRTLQKALVSNNLSSEFSNSVKLRLIAVDGMLFAVRKAERDKTDTDLLRNGTVPSWAQNIYSENGHKWLKKTKERESKWHKNKNIWSRTSRLERESLKNLWESLKNRRGVKSSQVTNHQ
jgi:hypothetical protein